MQSRNGKGKDKVNLIVMDKMQMSDKAMKIEHGRAVGKEHGKAMTVLLVGWLGGPASAAPSSATLVKKKESARFSSFPRIKKRSRPQPCGIAAAVHRSVHFFYVFLCDFIPNERSEHRDT